MEIRVKRNPNNPILTPINEHSWESKAVMNASVVIKDKTFHMFYRALGSESKIFPSGKIYHRSYIGYAQGIDGIHFLRRNEPLIKPQAKWEALGCEDPRVTKIGNSYYVFYTAISEGEKTDLNVQIAGASTDDFKDIKKLGVISLDGRCKAAALFPEKINNKFAFLYTQNADSSNSTIYYAQVDSITKLFDKNKWAKTEKIPLLTPSANAYRGPELGAVPIKTSAGWLLIYCPESFKREWFIGAALLDLHDPTKIIGKTKEPLLKPEMNYELSGYTNNVAFPSGAVIRDQVVFIYYGGADTGVCLATCTLKQLLLSLDK
ncbi:hypothetical protein C4559_04430 [Candidatus Microgenomates bacterium]|nr:MAG: hypothetical protein C4559_04430 [Candidatus Microgenomates bacterium]